jgi:hypothetical protein
MDLIIEDLHIVKVIYGCKILNFDFVMIGIIDLSDLQGE